MNTCRNYVSLSTLVWEIFRFCSSTSHSRPHAYFNSSNAGLCYVLKLPSSSSSCMSEHKHMHMAIMHEDWICCSSHCHYNPEGSSFLFDSMWKLWRRIFSLWHKNPHIFYISNRKLRMSVVCKTVNTFFADWLACDVDIHRWYTLGFKDICSKTT